MQRDIEMALPKITGTVIRRIDLHCSQGSSNKDYRIKVTQEADGTCRVFYEHGPAGRMQNGGEKTTKPVTLAKATSIADALIRSKENGRSVYHLVSDHDFPHPAIEAQKLARTMKPAALPARTRTTSWAALSAPNRALIRAIF